MLLPTLEPRAQYAASTVSQTAMATSTRKVGVEKETSDSRNWPCGIMVMMMVMLMVMVVVTMMVHQDVMDCYHCTVSTPGAAGRCPAARRR